MKITAQKILRVTFEWEGVEEMTERNKILASLSADYDCIFVKSGSLSPIANETAFTSVVEMTKQNTVLHYE